MVQNIFYEIQVEQLAAMILNARNLVGEISELLYFAKNEE